MTDGTLWTRVVVRLRAYSLQLSQRTAGIGINPLSNVIRFPKAATDPPDTSIVRSQLNAYLLALAESGLTVGVGKDQIERDIRILESIKRSTENPLLREHILNYLTGIKDQLVLASLKLLRAKQELLSLAASNGAADDTHGR